MRQTWQPRPQLDENAINAIIENFDRSLGQSLLQILTDAKVYHASYGCAITFRLNLALRQLGEARRVNVMTWVYNDSKLLGYCDIATHTIVIEYAARMIEYAARREFVDLIWMAINRAVQFPSIQLDEPFLRVFARSLRSLFITDRLEIMRQALATAFLKNKNVVAAQAVYEHDYGSDVVFFDNMTCALYDLLDQNEALREPTPELIAKILLENSSDQNRIDALYWLVSFVGITLPWTHRPYDAQQVFDQTPPGSSLRLFNAPVPTGESDETNVSPLEQALNPW